MAPKRKQGARFKKVLSPSGGTNSLASLNSYRQYLYDGNDIQLTKCRSTPEASVKSNTRPRQLSHLLSLPVELQVEILKYVLTEDQQRILLKTSFPPKRHSKRWLKELNALGVVVPDNEQENPAPIKSSSHHPLSVLHLSQELYQIGSEIFWGGHHFQFKDWRHLQYTCDLEHQRGNLAQIRHISLHNIFDGRSNQKLQAHEDFFGLLKALPRLESFKLHLFGFRSRLIDEVLHMAFHDMHKLPKLKSYELEWSYGCYCGDWRCRIHGKETRMECIDLLTMEPSTRKAVFEKAWAQESPYNDA